MKFCLTRTIVYLSAIIFISAFPASAQRISIEPIGTYSTGVYDSGASEIVAHDPVTQRLFVVNGAGSLIDILNISNPSNPTLVSSISIAPYGGQANSVAVKNGIVAAAVQAVVKTDPGKVVFFDANGMFLNSVPAGALPDMLTFTPDGTKVLAANEGEPNDAYTIDPEGSVTIIDISGGVANATATNAGFSQFNGSTLDANIRIFGLNATVAKDLEPEYIAVAPNGQTALVTLQENNAFGVLNLTNGTFTSLIGLGFKNHNLPGNGLDASDRDNIINIANWQVFGMYQPDTIAPVEYNGQTYYITANEGDTRAYTGFNEEARVSTLTLDAAAFPNASVLQQAANLGRLTVTNKTGDTDGDGDFDRLYVFGGRSFSVWNSAGAQVYDSGDFFEQLTASYFPLNFNAGNTNNTRDDRSDNKGPEPEGLTTAKIGNQTFAFIAMERVGGIFVYNVTVPFAPQFLYYFNNRNFAAATTTAAAGDLGAEGILFIPAAQSPNGNNLLVTANEVSGTTTIHNFRIFSPGRIPSNGFNRLK